MKNKSFYVPPFPQQRTNFCAYEENDSTYKDT